MHTKIPIGDLSREEWLQLRKSGIGGSDAGAICGVNPFSSPMKVYRDKTCDIQEEQDNESIRQGHDLEQYVAERFMEATGLKVRRSNYMYRSTAHPFMIADVDRLVVYLIGQTPILPQRPTHSPHRSHRTFPCPPPSPVRF